MDEVQAKIIFSAIIGIAMAAAFVLGVDELRQLRNKHALNRDTVMEMLLSLSPLPPYIIVSFFMAPVWYAIYVTASQFAVFTLNISAVTILLAYILVDFSYYWEHRCAHKLPFLWSLYHAVHHSSKAYTIATAYRVSFLNLFMAPAFYLPWILLGIDPLLVMGFQMFVFHYQGWLHTELIGKMNLFDRIFNSPANHRMHHSQCSQHKDVNMGATLMFWDHVFGTYKKPEENIKYGIDGLKSPSSPISIYLDPFKHS